MTTIRQIIIDAYREGGLVQIGLTPESEELDEGLRKLQAIVKSMFGNEMGAPLAPVSYGSSGVTNAYAKEQDVAPEIDSYYVPSNIRLMANLESAKTVYLPPNPKDGARVAVVDVAENFGTYNLTINGNGRRIQDATSVTLSTNGDNKEWFYRSDLGDWRLIADLTVSSENPFPAQFDDLLITMLAMRLNPRYQAQTAPETVETLTRLRRQFRARYKQTTEESSEAGIVRTNSQKDRLFEGIDLSLNQFNRGLWY